MCLSEQCLQSALKSETQDDLTETLETRWNKVHFYVKKKRKDRRSVSFLKNLDDLLFFNLLRSL